jgi:hypothetical protein
VAVKYAEDVNISANLAGKYQTDSREKLRVYRVNIALFYKY